MEDVQYSKLSDQFIIQIMNMDCSPFPKERDSIYLSFYRFFRDTCWVATVNNEVIGFALGFIDQTKTTHGYLNYLFVKSEYRRLGIGERLLCYFENSLKAKGCELATLLTGKQENIKYYNKLGYSVNHDLEGWTEKDAVYDYYYNTKKVSLLIKELA
ncbi:GNAT family N-acetyltransferase [Paenibacillus sp. YIM B09110]|uniref:GNAT family N-acetyltransferase n=1 Tax=Paenibacillus sp. YIM B09110 TaxID=3126102 RepID=UPI00301CD00E